MNKKLIILYLIAVSVIYFLSPNLHAEDTNTEIITMSFAPAEEPVPALSYKLLPRYIDQKNGNAALFYYAAAGLYPDGDTGDINEKIHKWRNLPIEQLNRKEVEETLALFTNCLRQIKLAAQRNSCQWEMPIEEGFAMQLPHLSTFRQIVFAMQLQIRLDIADGRINNAIDLLQQGMYMGRSIAQGPTIIQILVGIAIDAIMLKNIEEMIQSPNSPNLYWALSSLPRPMVDMQIAIQYELDTFFIAFPEIKNIENELLSTQQASNIIYNLINQVQALSGDISNIPFNNILPAAWVMMHYSDAKKYLLDKDYSRERIDAMPAAQAVLIYQKQQYIEIADDMFKWLEIPYRQSQPHMLKIEEQLSAISSQGIKGNLFSVFLPALSRVAFLQVRLERNIALLRTIEALRMYTAEHSGQFPESLADITSVPVPLDPVSGKEFIYKRVDLRNAHLEAPVSLEKSDKTPVYELSIKK
ncbi:MAG: hypothetical protein JW787_00910 [Sedimentisphaerales bacterium]|nr:hypothetical protein [Sedimentisphaerales bacterium]